MGIRDRLEKEHTSIRERLEKRYEDEPRYSLNTAYSNYNTAITSYKDALDVYKKSASGSYVDKNTANRLSTSRKNADLAARAAISEIDKYITYAGADAETVSILRDKRNQLKNLLSDTSAIASDEQSLMDYWNQFENEDAYNYLTEKSQRAQRIESMTARELEDEITATQEAYDRYKNDNGDSIANRIYAALRGTYPKSAADKNALSDSRKQAEDNIDRLADYKTQLTELERGRYDKIASAELDGLSDDILSLVDDYNAAKDVQRTQRFDTLNNGVGDNNAYFGELQSAYDSFTTFQKQSATLQKLKSEGFTLDEIDALAEYRAYTKSQEEALLSKAAQNVKDYAGKNPGTSVLASLGSVAAAPFKAIGAVEVFDALTSKTDRPIDTESLYFAPTKLADSAREGVMEAYEWHPFNSEKDWFDTLYSTGISTADSVVAALAGGKFGGIIIGSQAAMNATLEAAEKGYSANRAVVNGVAAGIIESVFESFSIGNFKSLMSAKPSGVKSIVTNILKSVAVNASEEANTEVANILFDYLYNGGTSDYADLIDEYMSQGLKEDEARSRAAKDLAAQVGESALGGALQGLLMGGGGQAVGAINVNAANKEAGNMYKLVGNDPAKLRDAMLGLGKDTQAYKLASKNKQSNAAKWSDAQLGEAYEAYLQTVNEMQGDSLKSDISERFTELGENASPELISAVYKTAFGGGKLTSSEKTAVNDSKYARHVANELADTHNTSSSWALGAVERARGIGAANLSSDAQNASEDVTEQNSAQTEAKVSPEESARLVEQGDMIFTPEVYIEGNDNAVKVRKISSVTSDGQLIYEADNGELVKAEDVTFAVPEAELVHDNATKIAKQYGAEGAQVYIEAYAYGSRESLDDYDDAFRKLVSVGRAGTTVADINKYWKAKYIHNSMTDANKERVLKLGADAVKAEASTVKPRTAKRKPGMVTIAKSVNRKNGSMDNKSITVIRALAKATGINFTVYSKEGGENGYYDTKTGVVHLNLRGQYDIVQTAAHELTHHIRINAPAQYEALKVWLLERYAKIDTSESQYSEYDESVDVLVKHRQELARNRETPAELSYEEALEEVVADACQNMLLDGTAITQLAQENKNLADTIKEWLDDFLSAVKEVLDHFINHGNKSQEVLWLRGVQKDTTQLQELWTNALKEAAGNERTASEGNKNTADEGGVKNSVRDDFTIDFDKWYGNTTREERLKDGDRLLVGTTSEVLQSIGVKDYEIFFGKSKIQKILDENTKMTPGIIKKAVTLLDKPIVVMKSLTQKDSIVIFGDLYTDSEQPVMLSLLLDVKTKTGEVLDYGVVTSAYGRRKSNVQGLLNRSEILYLDENRTDNWLQALRLQLPSAVTAYGSIGSILDSTEKVKKISTKDSEYLAEDENIVYSDRDDAAVSVRELLADALDSSAQTDAERALLKEYTDKSRERDQYTEQLADCGKKLKELYFAKGGRDTDAIAALEEKRKKLERKINAADKKLLDLRAMEPMEALYQREITRRVKAEHKKGSENGVFKRGLLAS